MRFIARTLRGLYVQSPNGTVYYTPADGSRGYAVGYLDIEARSQRERAAEYRVAGNRVLARRLLKAARALERLAKAEPVAA